MRALIGEYAKIVILVIAVMGLIIFAFSGAGDGLLGTLKTVEPKATVGDEDSQLLVSDIVAREAPTLEVNAPKLKAGKTYNLTDKTYFRITAENADGEELPITIKKILNQENDDIISSTNPSWFVPNKGVYKVTYSIEETYLGVTKETTKTYRIVVD